MLLHRRWTLAVFALLAVALASAAPAAAKPAGLGALRVRSSQPTASVTGQRALVLVLAGRDPVGLSAFLADPQHPALTPAEFAGRFGPRPRACGRSCAGPPPTACAAPRWGRA